MSGGLSFLLLGVGVFAAGGGLLAILRPDRLVRRNRQAVDRVESGDESYFEQRRAWQNYPWSRPTLDPGRVRRGGWLTLALGIASIVLGVLEARR